MTIIRAAVVQDAPVAFDCEQTLARVLDRTAEAAAQGAQLVVFPEAFVAGYPKGLDFGARVGIGRDPFDVAGKEEGGCEANNQTEVEGLRMPQARATASRYLSHRAREVFRHAMTLFCSALVGT